MVANLTQILNFKANFHQEFELLSKYKIYANNGEHFKIVSIIKKTLHLSTLTPERPGIEILITYIHKNIDCHSKT